MDYMAKKNKLIVVCGPTASGKTSLGVKIANKHDGEILSVDSRQVYRQMDIGTGKDLQEYTYNEKKIPYHLIDIVEPNQVYNLYNYLNDFSSSFKKIVENRNLPIAVGGTGLYLEAVLKKYRVPNVPEDINLRKELMELNLNDLIFKLKSLNKKIYEDTDITSKKRIVRSIEVAIYGLNNEIQWGGDNLLDFDPLVFGVIWERSELIKRIDERLTQRLKSGMVEEVESLFKSGVSLDRMLLFGMEYKFIALYLKGEFSYEEMVENLKIAIHRLSKRQMTWFRGMERRGIAVQWIKNGNFEILDEFINKFI